MELELKKFDPLDYLKTEEDFRHAMLAAAEEDPGDGSLIRLTEGDIARARGLSAVSQAGGKAAQAAAASD